MFNVHMAVQNTNNLNRIRDNLAVENNVAANIEFAVAAENFATIFAVEWIFSKLTKTGIKNGKIMIALLSAPFMECVATNIFQISLRHVGESKR